MNKQFYVVTCNTPSGVEDQVVVSRRELISLLRRSMIFIRIEPLKRPDFDNLNFFHKEDVNND